jgi:hypothetical protein
MCGASYVYVKLQYVSYTFYIEMDETRRFTLGECQKKMAIAIQKTIFCCDAGTTNC